MGNYNWKKDISRSNIHETYMVNEFFLKKRGMPAAYLFPLEFQIMGDVLLFTNKGSICCELKEDRSCPIWGNVAIEYYSRGNASGIAITKADVWVHSAHRRNGTIEHCFIKRERLVEIIDNNLYERITKTARDNGSNTCCYLFNVELFKKHCVAVFEENEDEYEQFYKRSDARRVYENLMLSSEQFCRSGNNISAIR